MINSFILNVLSIIKNFPIQIFLFSEKKEKCQIFRTLGLSERGPKTMLMTVTIHLRKRPVMKTYPLVPFMSTSLLSARPSEYQRKVKNYLQDFSVY